MTAVSFRARFLVPSVQTSVVSSRLGWPSQFTSKGKSIRAAKFAFTSFPAFYPFEHDCLPLKQIGLSAPFDLKG